MKRIKTLHASLISGWTISLLILVLLGMTNTVQAQSISWSARLFPDNPEFVEVYLDATQIASNDVIRSAAFDVSFYDGGNRLLKKQTINFLDQKLRSFKAGTYHRFFKHANTAATRIETGVFKIFGAAAGGGGKADEAPQPLAQAKRSEWGKHKSGRLIDPVPRP